MTLFYRCVTQNSGFRVTALRKTSENDKTLRLTERYITSDFPKSSFIVADNKTVTSTNIINYAYLCSVKYSYTHDTGDTY